MEPGPHSPPGSPAIPGATAQRLGSQLLDRNADRLDATQREEKIHIWKNNYLGMTEVVKFRVKKRNENLNPILIYSFLPFPTCAWLVNKIVTY